MTSDFRSVSSIVDNNIQKGSSYYYNSRWKAYFRPILDENDDLDVQLSRISSLYIIN